MNLPSLVHSSRHSTETQQGYNQVVGGSYHRQDMAASFIHNSYPQPPSTYHYSQTPQPPPSPPVEEPLKCSLPSISSLLVYADGGSSNASESVAERQHTELVQGQHTPDMRCGQQQVLPYGQTTANSARVVLPPTPPMRPESVFEGSQSPSNASQHSAVSTPSHYFSSTALGCVDALQQRQTFAPVPQKRHSMPLVTSLPYSPLPIQNPNGPYYQASSQPPNPTSELYYQRSLPQNFPPSVVPVSVTPSSATNPWQHHHYISPSSQAAFPQSQDRYICQTCNKAFSRPSSLRIHSHSHTGEKPFKCPHRGCGKAFSVRSNMKRHERGCHSSSPPSL